MGNSSSSDATSVQELSDKELASKIKQDDEYALLINEIWDSQYVRGMKDLHGHQVPRIRGEQSSPGDVKMAELVAATLHTDAIKRTEKLDALKSEIAKNIGHALSQEKDATAEVMATRMQAICVIHEALVRQDERERRRASEGYKEEEVKGAKDKKKVELPESAKMGIEFGVKTMMLLIKAAGTSNDQIYTQVMAVAAEVLGNLRPMSLAEEQPAILTSIEYVKSFFNQILNRELGDRGKDEIKTAMIPLIGMSLAQGELSSVLKTSKYLMNMAAGDESWDKIFIIFKPILLQLQQFSGSAAGRRELFKWRESPLGPNIALSNENFTVTRTDSSSWGVQCSENVLNSGCHYVEFKIDRNDGDCLRVGACKADFGVLSDSTCSHNDCYVMNISGEVNMGGNKFNGERYGVGDTVGVFVNMDDKKMQFFRNGKGLHGEPKSIEADEIRLCISFGGTGQFVTLDSDCEVPDEIAGLVVGGAASAKPDEPVEGEEGEEEEKKQVEVVEESKQGYPTDTNDILALEMFEKLAEADESLSPRKCFLLILAVLEKTNSKYFSAFGLDKNPTSETKKGKIEKKSGLSVEVCKTTFDFFSEALQYCASVIEAGETVEYDGFIEQLACLFLRLLRSHLFAMLHLQLPVAVSGLDGEDAKVINQNLQKLVALVPSTPGISAVVAEASLTMVHTIDAFFMHPSEKLAYLIEALEGMKEGKDVAPAHQKIQQMLFQKLGTPAYFSQAFQDEHEEITAMLAKVFDDCLDLAKSYSMAVLDGQEAAEKDRAILAFLETGQKVLLSQAARNTKTGKFTDVLLKYTKKVLSVSQDLVKKITTKDQTGTILDILLPNLVFTLSVIPLKLDFLVEVMAPIRGLMDALNKIPMEESKSVFRTFSDTVESGHEYENNADVTHEVRFPGARVFKLKFDPQCNTESGYDYLECWLDEGKTNKFMKWEDSFGGQEIEVTNNDFLIFTFKSDGSGTRWGYKVDITAEILEIESNWLEDLRNTFNQVIIFMNKMLISGSYDQHFAESSEILGNILVRYGISDSALQILDPEMETSIDKNLMSLANVQAPMKTGILGAGILSGLAKKEESKDEFSGLFSKLSNQAPSGKKMLEDYIKNFGSNTKVSYKFSKQEMIEEIVEGSERVLAAYEKLKKSAGLVGPMASFGGKNLDQPERAVFAVYVTLFQVFEPIAAVIEDPSQIDAPIKSILKMANNIRRWAQQEHQRRSESNAEVSKEEIAAEIVRKCVILLNSQIHIAINEMGIKQVLINLNTSLEIKKSMSDKKPSIEKPAAVLKPGSKWMKVKKAVKGMTQLKTLTSMKTRSIANTEVESEDSEIGRVGKIIMEFIGAEIDVKDLVVQLHKRRSYAIARAVGLNNLGEMIKFAPQEALQTITWYVSSVFSESFKNSGKKAHYTHGIEGADPSLILTIQTAFFGIYQSLLGQMRLSHAKKLDCTDMKVTRTFLGTFEALSVPFEAIDIHKIIDLNLEDSIKFLTAWMNGLYINEVCPTKFDNSKCITNFVVHDEEGKDDNQEGRLMSLNVVNRLAGELEAAASDEEQSEEVKRLCLENRFGGEELNPIVQISEIGYIPDQLEEGWEIIEGSINEIGELNYLSVKRAKPHPSLQYLTAVSVISNDPIRLAGEFKPHTDFLVEVTDEADQEVRKTRKERLRESSWNLFKMLIYSCAGKVDTLRSAGSEVIKKTQLQEQILELFYEEFKYKKSKPEKASSEHVDLEMRESASGELWLKNVIKQSSTSSGKDENLIKRWHNDFQAACGKEGDGVAMFLNEFINKADTVSAKVTHYPTYEEFAELCPSTPEQIDLPPGTVIQNEEGKTDFFTIFHSLTTYNDGDFYKDYKIDLETFKVPKDYQAACEMYVQSPSTFCQFLDAAIPEENVFRRFIEMAEKSSVDDKPGLVAKEDLIENVPSEFLTSEGAFDLFKALEYIQENPGDARWDEVKEFIPSNIPAPYEAELECSLPYVASLLWTMHQTCGSSSMRKLLSREKYLTEIVNHMFLTEHATVSVTAFRMARMIIAECHSLQSFSSVWNQLDKGQLVRRSFPAEVTQNFLHTLIYLVGLRFSLHINERSLSYSRSLMLSYEANEFLRELSKIEEWRADIVNAIGEGLSTLQKGDQPIQQCVLGHGALAYLSLTVNPQGVDNYFQEWSRVSLVASNIAQGLIIDINPGENKVDLLCEEDEAMYTDTLEKVSGLVSSKGENLLEKIDMAQKLQLLEQLSNITDVQSDIANKIMPETPNEHHAMKRFKVLIETLCYDAICSIVTDDIPSPSDLIAKVFKRISPSNLPDMQSRLKYKGLKKLIKAKQSEVKRTAGQKSGEPKVNFGEWVGTLGEEKQILAVTADSMGIANDIIYQAVNSGAEDIDAITSFAAKEAQNAKKSEQKQLFTTKNRDDFEFVTYDKSSSIQASATSAGHLKISANKEIDEPKSVSLKATDLLEKCDQIPAEVTVLVAVRRTGKDATVLLSLGEGQVKIQGDKVSVDDAEVGDADINTVLRFKIGHNGQCSVQSEGGHDIAQIEKPDMFDGLTLSDIKLTLVESGTYPVTVGLLGVSVYNTINEELPKFYTKDDWEQSSSNIDKDGDRKWIKPRIVNLDATVERLALLGAPIATCQELAKGGFEQGLDQMLAMEDLESQELFKDRDMITEFKSLENRSQLSQADQELRIENCFGDRAVQNMPDMCFTLKRDPTATKAITDIKFESTENCIGTFKDESLYFVREEIDKATKPPLKDVIYVLTDDPSNLDIPDGYELLEVGGYAFNFDSAESETYLFLAYSRTSQMFGTSVNLLEGSAKSDSNYGMVDNFTAEAGKSGVNLKLLEEEIGKLSSATYPVLIQQANVLEKQDRQNSLRKLFNHMLKTFPEELDNMLDQNGFSNLLDCIGDDLDSLKKPFTSYIDDLEKSADFGKLLARETIIQLILTATTTQSAGGSGAEHIVESKHQYDNDMRYNETICIAGATKLSFVFDDQCKTESGCDTLRFYTKPDQQGECIYEKSGSEWPPFEYEGDTVYLYFYTDGSCTEWGYKFRVIPTMPPAAATDEISLRCNIENALWILGFVTSFDPLPASLKVFTTAKVLNPLMVLLHKSKDGELQHKLLTLLQTLMNRATEPGAEVVRAAKLLALETDKLYSKEKPVDSASQMLQSLVSFMVEVRDKYEISLDQKWFSDLTDSFELMEGLALGNDNILPALFEQFKIAKDLKIDIARESAHPYKKKYAIQQIAVPDASELEIEFTENSACDDQHAVLFSYDKQGLRPVEDDTNGSRSCAGMWQEEPKGPDISISNGGMSVTRTNSSSWGNVVYDQELTTGRYIFNLRIDNHGQGSDYLYIGICSAEGFGFSDCRNSGMPNVTWKRNGEFHQHGVGDGQVSGMDYVTGDEISFDVDMDNKHLVLFKNNVEMAQCGFSWDKVLFAACFGGDNQHITILSVKTPGGSSVELASKKVLAKSDKVFYHFPINVGYLSRNRLLWDESKSASVDLSEDSRTAIHKGDEGSEGDIRVFKTSCDFKRGKYYHELTFTETASDLFQVGVVADTCPTDAQLIRQGAVVFENDGKAWVDNEETEGATFAKGDKIGVYFSGMNNQVTFYVNNKEAWVACLDRDPDVNYVIAVAFKIVSEQKTEITTSSSVQPPEDLDLLGSSSVDVSNAESWGYSFKVKPKFSRANKMAFINTLSAEQRKIWDAYQERHIKIFTRDVDEQLVQYLDSLANTSDLDPLTMETSALEPKENDLIYYPSLEKVKIDELRSRFAIIRTFNQQVDKILPLLSLEMSTKAQEAITGLKSIFLKTRSYIFIKMKNKRFDEQMNKSGIDQRPDIMLNRGKATLMRNKGKVDTSGVFSVFGQLCQKLNREPNRSMRDRERVFKVEFVGEGGIDAGGPYNEVISTICEELQSKFLPLFVPTQNQVHNVGENRDGWILNPNANTDQNMEMFLFLGKMFGVAIRTQNNLNLSLPPLFWKRLIQDDVTPADLKSCDECCFQLLDIMRNLDAQGITADAFEYTIDETFTTADSAGKVVDLIEDGSETQVTYERAAEYADLVEKFRLSEGSEQYANIRKGMSAIIPVDLLSLYSWRQVQTKICGTADVNVDILMENTEYESIDKNARHVTLFWEVLREMTPAERSLFLRFVWGRSRLPAGKNWKKFKLTPLNQGGNIDNYLPVAHTCFFQLDLPAYSNKDIMREKIVYAITHCQAIDLDRVATGAFDDEDE